MRGLITVEELFESICTEEDLRDMRTWYIFDEFFFALIVYRCDKGFTRNQMADMLEMGYEEYKRLEELEFGEFENMTLFEFYKKLKKKKIKIIFKLDKNRL